MKRPLVLSACLALSLAGCQSTSNNSNAIKIGVIAPLTGDAAGIGADILHGAQLAVAKLNSAAKEGEPTYVLLAEDGRCSGSDAANAAQKLVNVDHVAAIIGGTCSSETLAVAPIAEAGKTVLLSPTSSSPDVTKAGTFVFRNYPSDALKTKAMAKYFATAKIRRLAMISENTDFSQGFRESLKKDLPAGTVVFDEVVDPGTKDFRTLMTRLKSMKFDAFFPNGNSDAVIGPMLQQFREAGFTQTAIAHDAADSVTMAKDLPEATEGFLVINVSSDVQDPFFAKAFTSRYGNPQYGISFAGYAYDAMNVLAQGIAAGGKNETLRDWLLKMPTYKGVVGTFKFDRNGDVVGIPYVLKKFSKGSIEKVQDIVVQ